MNLIYLNELGIKIFDSYLHCVFLQSKWKGPLVEIRGKQKGSHACPLHHDNFNNCSSSD